MTYADDKALRDALRAPFDPSQIGSKPGGSKRPAVSFVSHGLVTERLTDAAPDWFFTIDQIKESPDGQHVLGVVGTMTIGGKSIPEVGEPENTSKWGDELKLAVSDFIKRAAMRFGVALDLWIKEDLKTSGGGQAMGKGQSPAGRTAAEAPSPSSEPQAPSGGVGAGTAPEPPPDAPDDVYVDALWADAVEQYGSKVKVLKAVRERFGESVAAAKDVTAEQLDGLLSGAA